MNKALVKAGNKTHLAKVDKKEKFVTMRLNGQLFGLPVAEVCDVILPQQITRIPLAPPEVAGLINLRGRIVTVINMRALMGLPPPEHGLHKYKEIVVAYGDNLYSLIVDSVEEVMILPESKYDAPPGNLSGEWQHLASGVYRLDKELMVVLDLAVLFKKIEGK